MTTLLKVTKAIVCASMVVGRSSLERKIGRSMVERRSCGMKARDSRGGREDDEEAMAERRYKSVL